MSRLAREFDEWANLNPCLTRGGIAHVIPVSKQIILHF